MVGILLLAGLAFFAFGLASATRSKAQGAADAAALAAAGDMRDHLLPGVDLIHLERPDWERLLDGELFDDQGSCDAGDRFAARNASHVESCERALLTFDLTVQTNGTVGESVVPGTSDRHATANASAVIKPRCHLDPLDPGDDPPPGGGDDADPQPIDITCDDGSAVVFDPLDPDPWKRLARALFTVRLVD